MNSKLDRVFTKIDQTLEEIEAALKINWTEKKISEEERNYILGLVRTIDMELEEAGWYD